MGAKTKSGYDTKTLSGNSFSKEIKSDEESRIVEGYFSAFDVIDSDGDMIRKGAFSKSIKERGPDSKSDRKIAHLAFHDVRRPVADINVLSEDNKGLKFKSKTGRHTDGKDSLMMYLDSIIKEHSIGFHYVMDKIKFIDVAEEDIQELGQKHDLGAVSRHGGYFEITELNLMEGSYVTFGANPETPNLSGVKSQEDLNSIFSELQERTETLIKAIKDGSYSEKYNNMFEVELHNINHQYKSLIKFEPGKPTHKKDKPNSDVDEVSKFYQNL